jgi:hypothetical protein
MIKVAGYPIVAGAILCTLQTATGPPASALDRWVELTNNTRMTIVEIYISQVGAERWNIDLLADDFLAAGWFCTGGYKRSSGVSI